MHKNTINQTGRSISRQVSLRTVFQAVREHKSISRAELSRQTGFSKQTTSEVVGELLADGWLRDAGQTSGNVGRTATNYELNGSRAHVFGCDLGGTKISMAVADLSGKIVAENTVPTSSQGGTAVLDQIADLLTQLVRSANVPLSSILQGAVGAPGAYDQRTDRLRLVSNVSGFEEIRISAHLQTVLGVPVYIENDVTIAAKGELWAGEEPKFSNFAFMAIGTGIGLGIVSDGKIVRGHRGGAGEIASLPIGGNPFDSRSFRSGTLESLVSSPAIVQRYKASGGTAAETVAQIFDLLAVGDRVAIDLIDEVARELAVAIVAVCAITDPECIIAGGSIGSRHELIERIEAVLPRCTPSPVPIHISALGKRAALVGAVGVALDELHERLF